jgi:hypothetical protein
VAPCFGSQTGCRICGSQQPLVEAELQPSEKPKSISTEATEVEHVGNPNSCEHREAWLHGLISAMRPIFAEHGVEIPANIRVSCGFPSQRSLNGVRNQRIGECWADTDSKDGSFEIFISPTLADAMRVAGATAHELIHATVGLTAGHKGPFKRLALAIGLAGKMSETQEGEAFKRALEPILEGLGPYPHAELDARKRARLNGGPPLTSGPKTQGTRLLKAMCPLCNYTVRVTKKWVDDMGPPLCPAVPPKFPVAHGAMEIESEECR